MREIPVKKRMEVLKLYFEGESYDKIANACGISKGSVVNIINEMKKGFYPEFDSLLGQVDMLRDLAVELRKLGLKASQALLATVFMRRLMNLGVKPSSVEPWIKLCQKLSTPEYSQDKVVNAAMKLIKLEEEEGKSLEELLVELEALPEKLKQAKSSLDKLEAEITVKQKELQSLNKEASSAREKLAKLIRGVESLERLGVDKVSSLSIYIEECERIGYKAEAVKDLAKLQHDLRSIGLNPHKLQEQASEIRDLENRIKNLKGKIASYRRTLKKLRKSKDSLLHQSHKLRIIDGILRRRSIGVPCSYCGIILEVPLPSRQEAKLMEKASVQIICPRCRCPNRITARDTLTYIGWTLIE